MLSQKDIAKELNIAQSTVSRALKNDDSIPIKTILMIKDFARKNGYVAKRYKSKKKVVTNENDKSKRLLALINGNLKAKNPLVVLEITQGILQVTTEIKYELIVKDISTIEDAKKVVDEYANRILGCITILRFEENIIKYLSSHMACISINHQYDNLPIKSIGANYELAFSNMYKQLYNKGHNNIGFITIARDNLLLFRRISGFLRGAKLCNNNMNYDFVINVCSNNYLTEDEIVEKIIQLNKEENVTAFLAGSGSFAKKIIPKLQSKNIKIPEDISFGGFDEMLSPNSDNIDLFGAYSNYPQIVKNAVMILQNYSTLNDITLFSIDALYNTGKTVKNLA